MVYTRYRYTRTHTPAHAHVGARLFGRVSAYDALYPRYRSYDRTIVQEMEEIYRSPKNERKITNLVTSKNRGKIENLDNGK